MLRIAAGQDPALEVSDIELNREGPSYTCETVAQLKECYPQAELVVLMGTDMFLSFPSWRCPQKILAGAALAVAYRETVAQLKECYPQAELVVLMGTDMFLSFPSWRCPQKILAGAALAVAYRGDRQERQEVARMQRQLESQGAKVYLLENQVTEISSTQLRRMLAFGCADSFLSPGVGDYIRQNGLYDTGADWKLENQVTEISSTQLRRMLAFGCADSFLSPGVGDYIRQNGLYDTGADWKNLPMEQLEQVVRRLLKPNRVAHVLGCRDTAVELAQRWGADPVDAARAGLLHDITKALDGPLQLTLCQAYGKMLDDFSRKYPKTLHAFTGSLVARRLLHDITKALDGPLQLTLCQAYGKMLDDFSRKYPKTLHAFTGSLVARRIFGENDAVVEAIACHTTGKADMNLLETILYVADYMEPNRDFPGVARRIFGENDAVVEAIACHTTGKADMNLLETILYVADYMEPNRDFPGVERLRQAAFQDIQAALKLGLEMTLEHLKNQGSEVSPQSQEALDWLNR